MKQPIDLTKATARPWATDIDVETFDGARLDATIYVNHGSGQGGEICTFRHDPDDGLDNGSEEQRANAHLIVLAVNRYDALMAVAEAARQSRFHHSKPNHKAYWPIVDVALDNALAVLESISSRK